jgi:hypothetical protein
MKTFDLFVANFSTKHEHKRLVHAASGPHGTELHYKACKTNAQ